MYPKFKRLVKHLLNEISAVTINFSLFDIKRKVLHPGSQKKVVSFCLFGSDLKYFSNIDACIKSYQQYFSEWTLRFYVSADLPHQVLQKFEDRDCELVIMKSVGIDFRYTFWRFLALDDVNISHVLIRDIDSVASQREKIMVNQWLESGKTLHIIRDHPDHTDVIMAGLFDRRFDPKFSTKSAMLKFKKLNQLGVDQAFLKQLYNHYFPDLLTHDILARYPAEKSIFIPHENPNTFIGEINCEHQHRERDRLALSEFYRKLEGAKTN